MSGRVITVVYINDPIISQYILFSDGESKLGETAGESGVRLILGSKGVTVVRASSKLKQVTIRSMYACWLREMVLAVVFRSIWTPSSQLIGPKSDIFQWAQISLFKSSVDSSESVTIVKSSVVAPTIVNLEPSNL